MYKNFFIFECWDLHIRLNSYPHSPSSLQHTLSVWMYWSARVKINQIKIKIKIPHQYPLCWYINTQLWIDGKIIFRVYKWWDEVEPHSSTHSSDRMREKWWRFSGGWVLRVSRVWNPELLSGHLTYWGARGRGTRILKKSKQN